MAKDLKQRVEDSRLELDKIGVKMARYYFALKYPYYSDKEDRLNNLFYGKVEDLKFTEELESFVNYKKQEFNK